MTKVIGSRHYFFFNVLSGSVIALQKCAVIVIAPRAVDGHLTLKANLQHNLLPLLGKSIYSTKPICITLSPESTVYC